VTQTTSRSNPGNIILNPRLQRLLEEDDLNWDDPRQRGAFLEYWIKCPVKQEEEDD
jgi:hypothetical protein